MRVIRKTTSRRLKGAVLVAAAAVAAAVLMPGGAAQADSAPTPSSPSDLTTKVDAAAGVAKTASTVTSDHARFQVLRDGVIRLEYSPTGSFIDDPTFTVLNRSFPTPKFTSNVADGWLTIQTSAMTLRYKVDSGPFGPANTSVTLSKPSANGTTTAAPAWLGECPYGQVCQAGAASLSGGAAYAGDHTGYSSPSGFVAKLEAPGAQAAWNVLGAPAGTAKVTLRYGNGQPGARTVTMTVNGVATQVTLPATAGWDAWGTVDVPVTLASGDNTIAVGCGAGDTCSVNVDTIAVTGDSPAVPFAPSDALGGYIRAYDSDHGSYTNPVTCGAGESNTTCEASIPRMEAGLLDKSGWYLLDDSSTATWSADGWTKARPTGDVQDGYLFGYSTDYTTALSDLAAITGPSPMLPVNVFGNWFSRYHPYTAADYQSSILPTYTAAGTSLDTLSVDTDWKAPNQWSGWSWNPSLFPDPAAFTAWAKQNGIDTTLNLHASIAKNDPRYAEAQSIAGGTLPDGSCFVGTPCSAFDWGNVAQAQAYFALEQPIKDAGISFWWQDWCCDGSFVSAPGVTPDSWINHLQAQEMINKGERGVAFSRIGAALQNQRAGAYTTGAWAEHRTTLDFTGDTWGTWNTLASQASLSQAMGSIGQAYVSNDIGSFLGDPISRARNLPDDLYLRWLQLGTFQSIMRLHSDSSQNSRLPSEYGGVTQAIGDSFLRLREQLVPYLYTLSNETTRTGLPMTRALYLDYPAQSEAYRHDGEYLLGSNVLVAPVTTPGTVASTSVWFPPGTWTDYFTGATFTGPATKSLNMPLDRMPVFVKAGGIVPLQPASGKAETSNAAPITFRAYSGADGSYSLYSDAGSGLGYQHGQSTTTAVTYHEQSPRVASVTIAPTKGTYPGAPTSRDFTVQFVNRSQPANVLLNGVALARSAWTYDAATRTVTASVPKASLASPQTVTAVASSVVADVAEPPALDVTFSALPSISTGVPTTVTTTVRNAGPGAVSSGSVALTLPSGWTATPASGQSLGSLTAGASTTLSWTVIAPNADAISSDAALTATATYQFGGGTTAGTAASTFHTTLLSYGDRVGGLTDPAGDDNGPGTYTYPTDAAFNKGSFDLTRFDVYAKGDTVNFVTKVAAPINNPWGGNGMSTQRVNIYLHASGDSAATTPLLPGTNMSAAGAWSRVVVADGRNGEGVYGPDGSKVAEAPLTVVGGLGTIIVSVPKSALGAIDPSTATYQVSMFANAQNDEGIGNVRPVYSTACTSGGDGCPSWVGQYYFGGGAGAIAFGTPARDTDTSDPNAIDIMSGAVAQSTALDWTAGSPVTVPYLPLNGN